MTIREHLGARAVRFHVYTFPVLVVLWGIVIWGRPGALRNGLLLVALAAYSAIYVVLMVRTPCLRCSEPLRNAALNWGSRRQPPPSCPYCGLSIDQQVSEPRALSDKAP